MIIPWMKFFPSYGLFKRTLEPQLADDPGKTGFPHVHLDHTDSLYDLLHNFDSFISEQGGLASEFGEGSRQHCLHGNESYEQPTANSPRPTYHLNTLCVLPLQG